VNVRGDSSGRRAVISGVPQGSVLGPRLFLIFININENGIESVLLKFADDTKIQGVVKNVVQPQLLQDDLSKLVNWSKTWQTKCKIFHVGKTNQTILYMMDNQILESVIKERDLGILVSSDLKLSANQWRIHRGGGQSPPQEPASGAKNSTLKRVYKVFSTV